MWVVDEIVRVDPKNFWEKIFGNFFWKNLKKNTIF